MAYYTLELENVQNDKPEFVEYLKNGKYFNNCTGKPFSRATVDTVLN